MVLNVREDAHTYVFETVMAGLVFVDLVNNTIMTFHYCRAVIN